jgi:hypothetical protein
MPAAPWPRSHSTARIPNVEFDGPETLEAKEMNTGMSATTAAISAIRRIRCGPLTPARGSLRRRPRAGLGRVAVLDSMPS